MASDPWEGEAASPSLKTGPLELDADAEGADKARMLADLRWGLAQEPKRLSSKYFYDTRGSELFEDITRLEEYYLTRTERGLLAENADVWMEAFTPKTLVELGAGSARKTRILLDAMVHTGASRRYVPVDVAGDFLEDVAAELSVEYPTLDITPVVRDITLPPTFREGLPGPVLLALLGSTLGNFDLSAAVDLLSGVRSVMEPDDRLLLGVDLRPGAGKSQSTLERAYNDALGVTSQFNLNILDNFNRQVGATFDRDAFEHRAPYNAALGRMEMHLVVRSDTVVQAPGLAPVSFETGEYILTEISCKYDRPTIDDLFERAGLVVDAWVPDSAGRYAMVVGAPKA